MIRAFRNNRTARILFILAGMVIVYLTWSYVPLLYYPLHIQYASLRLAVRGLISFIPMLAVLLCLHKPSEILQSLGLNRHLLKGLGFAAVCCSPLLIGAPVVGNFDHHLSFDTFLRNVILAAFLEELIYRGFLFGQLFRYGKIGFIWAVIIPALLFGMGHLYQGHSLMSSLMAFGVTTLGALYFSWVYVECDYNLWVPIGLHMFMNFCWIAFPMEGNVNAVGAMIPNILRFISIALTVTLIVISKRKHNSRIFNYPILSL